MANGLLGKAMSVVGNVTPCTIDPGATFATINISMVNMGAQDAKVKVALTTNAAPSSVDYIEYDAVIPSNGGVLDRSCILASANENVIVTCDKNTVAIRVTGLEEIGT